MLHCYIDKQVQMRKEAHTGIEIKPTTTKHNISATKVFLLYVWLTKMRLWVADCDRPEAFLNNASLGDI